ncbi:substrate-binding periplasmic protein [Motiliproteus sp.]|uniref:substrate-binding periplasmic protein n=1 Tax=Motiliproteus sp. TaxID=1898955 RepID=UPI003BA9B466
MKQRLSLLALLLLGLSSLPTSAIACGSNPIRVGFFEFPPFYSETETGDAEGILIDELDRVMTKLGCRWQGRFDPTGKLLERHINGETDLLMLIQHPLLLERARYSLNPVGNLQLNSYWIGDKPPVSSLKDLQGKRVIVIRGYGYGGLFRQLSDPANQIKLQMAKDHRHAFELLSQQQGDYMLGYRRPAEAALLEAPVDQLGVQNVKDWDIYFVLSPKYTDQDLIRRLDEVLADR